MDDKVEELKDRLSLVRSQCRNLRAWDYIKNLYITELEDMLVTEFNVDKQELDRIYEVCKSTIFGEDK